MSPSDLGSDKTETAPSQASMGSDLTVVQQQTTIATSTLHTNPGRVDELKTKVHELSGTTGTRSRAATQQAIRDMLSVATSLQQDTNPGPINMAALEAVRELSYLDQQLSTSSAIEKSTLGQALADNVHKSVNTLTRLLNAKGVELALPMKTDAPSSS